MTLRSSVAWATAAALVFIAAHELTAQNTPASPEFDTQTKQRIRVVTIGSGLFHPWSLAFLPDGRLLVAERNGQLRLIRNGTLDPTPVWKAAPEKSPQDSLHSVAVHPQFAKNGFVYLSYPKWGPQGNTLAIARGKLEGSTLVDVKEPRHGSPAAILPAVCCSAPTAPSISPSAIAIASAARAPKTTASA
jgi:glucose/arabinose dehydrogenase